MHFLFPLLPIRSMFTSGLTESSQREVRLIGVESESMHLVLDYAYTSRVILSESNVQALFTAASIFQIPALQDQCALFMISRLDPQNCTGVYMFADAYGHQELRERSKDYMRKKVGFILRTSCSITLLCFTWLAFWEGLIYQYVIKMAL